MTILGRPGRLIGSGRASDVFELEEGWVLRRDREGYGDGLAEAALMERLRGHGYPVPRVRRADCTSTELVMERLHGPTMLEAFGAGRIGPTEAGETLARLLRRLHAVPGRVIHLDLHPDNVMLTPDGPVVIDWTNAEEGEPGLDWGMSAVILAQVAVTDEGLAAPVRATLAALLADPSDLTETGLTEARRRRAANPTMTAREVDALGEAEELVRSFLP
ncbi:phosphotransferase [Streptomyces cinnabarinus]|uniref:Phosphotransferase n=1 Tax=Streptomyces cinnabarinus TaxID=67287 RepID=A0ABY7KCV7_9ACTN|nr:phosphotransferase [Streptomyces cinnabarinus]WAZ21393.1 phosphotransferase [Streptomyces cinnabarinus]